MTEILLTLMRHGRSRADDENVHEGRYDSPLTETGRQQVQARAADFAARGYRFDAIIASTLQRAQASAKIVSAVLQAPVESDPDWMEFNNGPLAGLDLEQARQQYPPPPFRGLFEPFHGSGESEIEFHSRAARAVEKVIRRGPGAYLVVAHGGVLNAALRVIFGAPLPINGSGLWIFFGDAGFVRLRYQPGQHQWLLLELCPE